MSPSPFLRGRWGQPQDARRRDASVMFLRYKGVQIAPRNLRPLATGRARSAYSPIRGG